MRITGGRVKGRRLALVKGPNIRPTSDKIREAIFSVIGQDLTGLTVLDLYAGTGSLGIEALSRGASGALFIDISQQAVYLIRKNLTLCGFTSSGAVLKWDLVRGVPWKHALMKKKIDVVFIDPPYGKDLISPLLLELDEREILTLSSVAVVESSKTDLLPATAGRLEIVKTKIYGETKIDIYRFGRDR